MTTTADASLNIEVWDALMGRGKTQRVIREINAAQDRYLSRMFASSDTDAVEPPRFVYIAPYLAEASRIAQACPALCFVEPKPVAGRKLDHFNDLIAAGSNIASTHALFSNIDRETYELLKAKRYTLVIDEVVECVRQYDLSPRDIQTLREANLIYVDDKQRVRWNPNELNYDGRFRDVKDLCCNGNLVWANETVLMWELPVDFLALFERVVVLTYLFDGSLMANYLKANGVPYRVHTLNASGDLVPIEQRDDAAIKAKLKSLVKIVIDERLNRVGTYNSTKKKGRRENPLSASWYERAKRERPEVLAELQRATYQFFKRHAYGPSADHMWTVFKAVSGKLKGDGYAKSFVPVNLKATNEFRTKKNLAYLVNMFVHPVVRNYLAECNIEPNGELFALSEMVQWLWRSQVRDGKPITVFVPSERMRSLLVAWLNDAPLPGIETTTDSKLAA